MKKFRFFFSKESYTVHFVIHVLLMIDIIENASSLLFCLDSTYFTWVYK